jgi:hypothetical protein
MSLFLAGPTYLFISIPIDPGSVLVGVVISLLSGVIIFFFKSLLRSIASVLGRGPRYSLAGIWIGTCKLPNYPNGVEPIEIYRLTVRGEHVRFRFFMHSPDGKRISKYLGAGICRGELLSAYYYNQLPHQSESGVFAMRKISETLQGVYTQHHFHANEELRVSPEKFFLMRVEIPLWNRLRMRVNKPPFVKYEEVEKLYGDALAAHRLRSAAASPEIAGQ